MIHGFILRAATRLKRNTNSFCLLLSLKFINVFFFNSTFEKDRQIGYTPTMLQRYSLNSFESARS